MWKYPENEKGNTEDCYRAKKSLLGGDPEEQEDHSTLF